jgi:hypothetical protein
MNAELPGMSYLQTWFLLALSVKQNIFFLTLGFHISNSCWYSRAYLFTGRHACGDLILNILDIQMPCITMMDLRYLLIFLFFVDCY